MAVGKNGAIRGKREQTAEGTGPYGRLGLWKFDVTLSEVVLQKALRTTYIPAYILYPD